MVLLWAIIPLVLLGLLFSYVRINDKGLKCLPPRALAFSPRRCTPDDVRVVARELSRSHRSSLEQLPPKTGRRYIVVGGAGFLGGWICVHLLQRGEDPKKIRVLDIRPPTRHDLTTGRAKDIDFVQVDISDAEAVEAAFKRKWPESSTGSSMEAEPEITIFHTAANIRFYERHSTLVPNSAKVNVTGTQNVINSARSIGATTLVYTSSGSVAVRNTRFFLWPWEKEPKYFVQVINDDDNLLPKRHEDFFSNYAYTKIEAERRVRKADKTSSGQKVLRTGCIRPGNGVFGPGGDMLCGAYIVRKANPTWISTILQSFVYVENCSLSHLCYEQRLIELATGSNNPDIGGQAFTITDPGPPPTYGDVYVALGTLTKGETFFPSLSPTGMLLVAHLIEIYYLTRHRLLSAGFSFAKWIPPINGDLVNLQPSLFSLTMVHLIFDDSRARLAPEQGGLGYRGLWTTLEALHKTVEEHNNGLGRSDQRSSVAGVSFGFGLVRAQKGVKEVNESVVEKLGVDPLQVLN